MADVRPFRGIRYHTERVPDLASVTTPPYDVISEVDQEAFYRRHPQNMIRLILGKSEAGDSENRNPHTRAAAAFNQWMADGTLVQDTHPACYLTSVDFRHHGEMATRYGLIARVGLEPFEKGIILPHEATYSAIKTERLGLMKACHANFSPIFSLFADSTNLVDTLKTEAASLPVQQTFEDSRGDRHRLWRIEDEALTRRIQAAFADEKLFIADGHHRYETALAYRDWIAGKNPAFSNDHPANSIMMYLSSMRDPGLVVLPTHRLVRGLNRPQLESFPKLAADRFELEQIPIDEARRRGLDLVLKTAAEDECRIGVVLGDRKELILLKAKHGDMAGELSDRMPEPLTGLDVSLLTHLIFPDLLGILPGELDDVGRIRYTSASETAVETVLNGSADAAFLLNPTRIDQVRRIAEAGLTMPRKTTYFAPKVITGLVLNTLRS